MENRGLLFIPDISGFTRFVTEMEIDHSRHVIQELLELLINANDIGLEISEIEGDAILFYKFGDIPDVKLLYEQVEKMFCEFHRYISSFEYRRLCQCKACRATMDLTLKVITHYGEFTGYQVKNFNKLIGKDVIVAHQLLKNEIVDHEYWLVTDKLSENQSLHELNDWMNWDSSSKKLELGEVPFQYTPLTHLKNGLIAEPPKQLDLKGKRKMISVSADYELDINTLFYASAHYEFRHLWVEGLKSIDEVTHYLPRIGTKHRRVLDDGEAFIYTAYFSYSPARIVMVETDEDKKTSTHFILERITESKTKFTMEFFIGKNIVRQTLFQLTQKSKIEGKFSRSLEKLREFSKGVKLPVDI